MLYTMNMSVNSVQPSNETDVDPLTCQKNQFSLPETLHYLNCAYMSPLSKRVEGAGVQGIARKSVPTRITPADFFSESQRVRELFGELVNAPAERIAIIPAASYGLATVAKNMDLATGQNIVVAVGQFPSNVYPWRGFVARDVELRTVSPPTGSNRGEGWNARLLEAIDASTGLIALPHVHWTDGTLFDLKAIGEKAQAVGAALIIDGTQSVGALPFDVERLKPDALIVAGYKTLLGPYGLGYAYYGERFEDGTPLEDNWVARHGSENFSRLIDYQDAYAPGAVRFDVGERSNPILLPMGMVALESLLRWQPARIQAYCRELMGGTIESLLEAGYKVENERYRAHHLFGVRLPEGVLVAEIGERLEAHNVVVSVRGDAVRVSPNVYNDEGDAEALLSALVES